METMSLSEQESTENLHPSIEPESQAMPADEHVEKNISEAEAETSKHQGHKHEFEKFMAAFEKLPDTESKLQYAIDFMTTSLSQGGTPHFKSFWEARNICLQLFKENIPPALRSILWDKYNDLSKEARRLKEILDEQSAFAVEQIEIAVKALEDEIAGLADYLEGETDVQYDIPSIALKHNLQKYGRLQQELNFLNVQASRINSMRKELIRTEMRVRQKNKFFQRLSEAGDKVFPRRKDLIKEVSQLFMNDVDAFINAHFSKEDLTDSLFALREEVKTLQNMAKILTLNTHSFTQTRLRLSECWDKIKNEDKERKKERTLQKEVFTKNFEESMQMLKSFSENYQEQQPQPALATKQLDELVAHIRSLELGRSEIQTLKETVQAARKIIQEKIHAKEQEKAHQDQEKEKLRRNALNELRNQVEKLIKNCSSLDADAIEAERQRVLEALSSAVASKLEKQDIERLLKPLRDIISEKRESSLLSLSDDDRQSLQQLKEVLKQRKARRQEIKTQIDLLRKTAGSSGLDFEQAMSMNDQVAAEKERLEKINQGIEEIEAKIYQLSKK